MKRPAELNKRRLVAQKVVLTVAFIFINWMVSTSCGVAGGTDKTSSLRVLVLGSNAAFSDLSNNVPAIEAAFPPAGIANSLQQILVNDAALTTQIPATKIQVTAVNINQKDTSEPVFCQGFSLMSWFYWPTNHASTLALLQQGWDYVVMIEDPNISSVFPEYDFAGVNVIAQTVVQAGSKPLLLMTWSSGATSIAKFGEYTYRVGNGAGVPVVPAGYAYTGLPKTLQDAGTRPGTFGTYVAAASIYSEMFNRSASSSSYLPAGITIAQQNALASAALTAVESETSVSHYSGNYLGATHFVTPPVGLRKLKTTDWNSSTEWGYRYALEYIYGLCGISYTSTVAGYQSYVTSGFPYGLL